MTLTELDKAVNATLSLLELGRGSYRRSSAYHDYVALEFATFVTPAVVRMIEANFRGLCERYGWQCCRVTVDYRRNAVFVTMHQWEVISTGDKRMVS